MNVFSSVKKAIHHIQHRDEETEALDTVLDPHKRDILKNVRVFTEDGSSLEAKEEALRDIGHNAYVGLSKTHHSTFAIVTWVYLGI